MNETSTKEKKTARRRRRGTRGSKKSETIIPTVTLDEQMKELIKNEVQKYKISMQQDEVGKEIQKLEQTLANTIKNYRKKADEIIKSQNNKLMDNNFTIQQINCVNKHRNPVDKPLDEPPQNSKKNAKTDYLQSLLQSMSQMNTTPGEPKKIPQVQSESCQGSCFPKLIKPNKMKELLEKQGKSSIKYLTGTFRISNKDSKCAYVTCDKEDEDVLIEGYSDRNRAMDTDVVAIQVHPKENWIKKSNGNCQKTGSVLSILEERHSRTSVGTLLRRKKGLDFQSRDPKFPTLRIDLANLPKESLDADYLRKTLFHVRLVDWTTPFYCTGEILQAVGCIGELETEITAILLENGLDVTPYEDKSMKKLSSKDYQFDQADLVGREDWRSKCIFTIDPATAVGLDDAISCRKVKNGNFEVGVHIADVTHFLKFSTPLDKRVAARATTIYLPDTVYHMLPEPLCQLCSLVPGKDRLTLSVIWTMSPTGEVKSYRFAKTIVNSCLQMSYQQAQRMIDNPDLDWSEVDLPSITNNFTATDISNMVNNLFKLSKCLRSKRFECGALKIDQPELRIVVDEVTKLPTAFYLENRLQSTELIEEFMLLANITVATHLYKKFPETALLRHHEPPRSRNLRRVFDTLKKFGIHLNTESAGSLQGSIEKYQQTMENGADCTEEEFVANCRMMVINALCAQAMVKANYICAGNFKEKMLLKHYALNIPCYTHFTSPMRRYADCIVHRLLSASLNKTPMPKEWSTELCTNLAENCNRMKDRARNAQQRSNEIYFAQFLAKKNPINNVAVVVSLRLHSFDAILCHVGVPITIDLSQMRNTASIEYSNVESVETIRIRWLKSKICQVINIFTILNVRISKHSKSYSIHATLIPPNINQ